MPTFDRRPSHDLRSYSFVHASVGRRPGWWEPVTGPLDQGNIGGCVGFGWSGAVAAMPRVASKSRKRTARNAHGIATYELATALDDITGAYPDEDTGSSVLGGAKAMRALGYIDSYTWPVNVAAILDALHDGPVVLGIPWYNSMFEPADDGALTVKPTTGTAGGHCLYVYGARGRSLWLRNSWGRVWGLLGSAYIDASDLQTLLDDGGEACLPQGSAIA